MFLGPSQNVSICPTHIRSLSQISATLLRLFPEKSLRYNEAVLGSLLGNFAAELVRSIVSLRVKAQRYVEQEGKECI